MKNEKFVRITKMRERQRVGKSVGKNGADRLAWCGGVINPQFAKSKTKTYLQSAIKQSMIKRGMPTP